MEKLFPKKHVADPVRSTGAFVLGNNDDYLRVKVVGATTVTVLEELGAANTDAAAWASFSTSLNAYAGQTIYLLVEAADGGSGSLVEAAIDDVLIE